MTGTGSTDTTARGEHAVVLGAGIAGMLAARVLTDSHRRVTVVDRDDLDGEGQRRGAPQGRHVHGLTETGRLIMEGLFPGVTQELREAGVLTPEVLTDTRWYFGGLRAHSTSTGLTAVLASRPLLERVLRTRLTAHPEIEIRPRTSAAGLVADAARRVVGVRVGGPGGSEETLTADLVVDATGRASRAPDWLADLGVGRPVEERVEIELGYSSRIYRRLPEHLDGDRAVNMAIGPGRRGATMVAIEGDRWHVTLGGTLGDHPPNDDDGYVAFAASLPSGDVHRVLGSAEPIEDAVPYRFKGSRRRYFERLATPPEGFVVIGDAVCCLNPVYAQGMTVAAQEAVALRDCLRSGSRDLPRRFYRAAARRIDAAWQTSTGSDLAHPAVEGRRTLRTRLTNRWLKRILVAAHRDPAVARTFLRVSNLVEPPTALLSPSMVRRVLRHGSTRGLVPSAPAEPSPEPEVGTPA